MLIRFDSYTELFGILREDIPRGDHTLQGMGTRGHASVLGPPPELPPNRLRSCNITDRIKGVYTTDYPPLNMQVMLAGHFVFNNGILYINTAGLPSTITLGNLARVVYHTDSMVARGSSIEPANYWGKISWWAAQYLETQQPPPPAVDSLKELISLLTPQQASVLARRLKYGK